MKRITALDSLRGIAALIVVIHHCSLVLPDVREWIDATYLLRPFVAGSEAVSVFFVLSGFVLYGLLNSETAPDYASYVAKRLIRLWPTMAVAVTASALLYLVIQPDEVSGTTVWFSLLSWHDYPSFISILGHFALFNSSRYLDLDNVIWSLAHEVKFSLVFPLLVPIIRHYPIHAVIGATYLSVGSACIPQPDFLARTFDPVSSLHYLFLFVAGGAVAAKREAISNFALSALGRKVAPAGIAIAVVLLNATRDLSPGYLAALGAVLLVAICATSPVAANWLDKPALTWLGNISYSLYLTHLPVLLTLVYTLHGKLPTSLILCVTPFISLGVAELMYRLVEQHSIAFARRIGNRSCVSPNLVQTPEAMRAFP